MSFWGLYALEVRLCSVMGFLSEKRTFGWAAGDGSGDTGRLVLFLAAYCGIGIGEAPVIAAGCVLDADACILACFSGLARVCLSSSESEPDDSVESLTLAW